MMHVLRAICCYEVLGMLLRALYVGQYMALGCNKNGGVSLGSLLRQRASIPTAEILTR